MDRDGVINRAIVREGKPYPPKNLLQLEILPGVKQALKKLSEASFLLIVVTNQPDVARGAAKKEVIDQINANLLLQLPLDVILTCYHDNEDQCLCRKPLPGSLFSASKEYDIDLSKSFMVGDRWSDIEAGNSAGCKSIFISCGYNEKKPVLPDFIVYSLLEAQKIITESIE
jgi:D-glycero-D-manno-heptose 1,7-bisphosphate phosphatase